MIQKSLSHSNFPAAVHKVGRGDSNPNHTFCLSLPDVLRDGVRFSDCFNIRIMVERPTLYERLASVKRGNLQLINYLQILLISMTPSIASAATQTIATIAFGIVATLISALTVWQGRRAWRRLYGRQSERNAESDVESRDCPLHHWPPMRLLIFA